MPCANVHMLLARRLLKRWEEEPGGAPFPPGDEACRAAFLHGSLGPDMGYIPGNDRFVSDLAHYWESGELGRALLAGARSAEEAAFAWGWAAHTLADAALHPSVGRRCGEILHGDRTRRLDALEDEATHVAVEVGLDAAVQEREGDGLPHPPAKAYLDQDSARLLSGALEETYGLPFQPGPLLAAHRRATRLTRRWRAALSLLARTPGMRNGERPGPLCHLAGGVAGAVRLLARAGSATDGFLRPVCPSGWLIDEVYRVAAGFPDVVARHVASGLGELENRNLETGLPQGAVEHLAGQRVLERLRALGGGVRSGGSRGPTAPATA